VLEDLTPHHLRGAKDQQHDDDDHHHITIPTAINNDNDNNHAATTAPLRPYDNKERRRANTTQTPRTSPLLFSLRCVVSDTGPMLTRTDILDMRPMWTLLRNCGMSVPAITTATSEYLHTQATIRHNQ
jgi:hypothetical protein